MKNNSRQQNGEVSDGLDREPYGRLPLVKINFILMAAAAAVIITGFLLMTGAPSTETEFNPDIFSTRRIVIGPTMAFLGFIFMGIGIMWRPVKKKLINEPEEGKEG